LCNAFLAFATLTICASAQAVGLFRAYLASDGLDTNPCSVVAPCRLLPAALAAVADGGVSGVATTSAIISDSVLSANSSGVDVEAISNPSSARASMTRSTLSGNSVFGVYVHAISGGTALVTVGSNMVTGNSTGLSVGGAGTATLESIGNNIVRQDTTPVCGTITTVAPM
jgi:hypothetical protein